MGQVKHKLTINYRIIVDNTPWAFQTNTDGTL